MAYFAFLVEASTDAMLKVFREESSTSVLAEPLEDSDDEDSDKELEEEDIVEEPDKVSGNKKPGQRRYSKTLLRLIHKYDPSLECRSSDISCLLLFHQKNATKFAFSNKPLFADQLIQLTKIITTLIPSTSYLRNVLVKITGSFKAIWVKKGEDEKTGEHLSIVAKTVRAPKLV